MLRSHERQVSSHGIPPLVEVNLMLASDGILFKEERYYVRVAIYLECERSHCDTIYIIFLMLKNLVAEVSIIIVLNNDNDDDETRINITINRITAIDSNHQKKLEGHRPPLRRITMTC